MKRPQEILREEDGMRVLADLTNVFEGIASMRIAQIKNQVLQSQNFFDRLWQMYSQIRAGSEFNFGRHLWDESVINKELFIVITAEGGFSGDIDQKLIRWMLKNYDKQKNDIIVIGHHGAVQLAQQGISFKKYFKLPAKDANINVTPIIKEVQNYKSTLVSITGIVTSLDKPRSLLLTVSILFLLSLVLAGWWYVRFELSKNVHAKLPTYALIAAIIYGSLGVFQFVFATFSDSSLGMMCKGCMSGVFGFPRINLFAAEPQFFANALLPFFFVSIAAFYRQAHRLSLASFILIALTIFLTFSRGAFLAIIVGLLAYGLLLLVARKIERQKIIAGGAVVVVCAVAALGLQVASASYRYRATPNIAYNTLRSNLEHVSLGLVRLPAKTVTETTAPVTNSQPGADNDFESPGLIEASTTDRLSAAALAQKAWTYDLKNTVFGVGTGNLGPFVVKNVDTSAPGNLTVYIYYVLVLAETGVIGLLALLAIILGGLRQFIKNIPIGKSYVLYATVPVTIIAFLTQYFFFGTYINTIYIWLWAGITLGLAGLPLKPKLHYNQKSL